MIDNYTKYPKEIGDKIPASGKEEAYKASAGIHPGNCKKAFNESLSSSLMIQLSSEQLQAHLLITNKECS